LTLLDEWQIEKASILGMDMGGQPALAFAALHPERIERLIVMNSLVFGDERTSWEIRWLRKFGFNRFALRHLGAVVFWRAEKTFLPRGTRLHPETRDDFWRAFSTLEVRTFVSKMCAGYQGTLDNFPSLYHQISCPTLVLWARTSKSSQAAHTGWRSIALRNSRNRSDSVRALQPVRRDHPHASG
jgi:pimeloyl-ACP methyl ester carboxylesterase